MKVQELNREQLIQLKQQLYETRHPEGVSYGELAEADDLITDAECIEHYAGIDFVEDVFFK